MKGKISLHCGIFVKLPMRTKSLMFELSVDNTADEPMLCNTIYISPNAMSSSEALLLSILPNREAVASSGKPSKSCLQISLICKFIFAILPCV